VTDSSPLFRFVQIELPWQLGPPDGRYLLRAEGDPDGQATHVLVFATLGAPERRRLAQLRRQRDAPSQPDPTPVTTGRATVIDVGSPLNGPDEAAAWLAAAGDTEVNAGLETLNRALRAFRLVSADPHLPPASPNRALVIRIGYGAGEQVADGLWHEARELVQTEGRRRRSRLLEPQSRLAAVLGARERMLVCEELTLRARLDLDQGHGREAALQAHVALDSALTELAGDPAAPALAQRLDELHAQREPVARAAQAALAGDLSSEQLDAVSFAVAKVEAALRARAVHRA